MTQPFASLFAIMIYNDKFIEMEDIYYHLHRSTDFLLFLLDRHRELVAFQTVNEHSLFTGSRGGKEKLLFLQMTVKIVFAVILLL